jgi:hypothetical protein
MMALNSKKAHCKTHYDQISTYTVGLGLGQRDACLLVALGQLSGILDDPKLVEHVQEVSVTDLNLGSFTSLFVGNRRLNCEEPAEDILVVNVVSELRISYSVDTFFPEVSVPEMPAVLMLRLVRVEERVHLYLVALTKEETSTLC